MGGIAASAGYMVAVPAARIFARAGDADRLDRRAAADRGGRPACCSTLGITVDDITSGPLKDQPSFTQPLTPQGRDGAAGAGDGHVRPVRRHGRRRAAHGPGQGARARRRPRLYRAAGAASSAWSTRSAASAEARDWLAETHGVLGDAAGGGCRQPAAGRPRDRAAVFGPVRCDRLEKPCFPKGLCLTAAWAIWQRPGGCIRGGWRWAP